MDYSHLLSSDTSSFMRSPVREIFKRVDLSSIHSFAGGYPSDETFPVAEMARAYTEVLSTVGGKALQYGATQGVTHLRECLSLRYGVPLERIQITTSSQQGIDVCTRILADPGDTILTSSPTYLGALQSFRSYRANVVGVKRERGILEDYTRAAEKVLSEGGRIKFLYTIPDFQNPSGETLSLEDRKALVELSRRYGFLIVEDSPYRDLRYSGESIPSIYSLDPDRVLHLGSFSKVLAPGLRLGWIFASPDILDWIYVCKQSLDLCPPILDQWVAATLLRDGTLDRNLQKSIGIYRRKRDLMLSLLEEHMPKGVSWTHPDGGLFLFMTLPEGFDSVSFYERALSNGVAYVAGSFFHPDGGGRNTMRLNFSFMGEDRIREGIVLLSSLIRDEINERQLY